MRGIYHSSAWSEPVAPAETGKTAAPSSFFSKGKTLLSAFPEQHAFFWRGCGMQIRMVNGRII